MGAKPKGNTMTDDEQRLFNQSHGHPKLFAKSWKYPRTAATLAVISILIGAHNVATTGYLPEEGLAILIDFTLYALGGFGF